MKTPSLINCSCVTYEDVVEHLNTCNAAELCATPSKVEENLLLAQEFLEGLTGTKLCPYKACKVIKSDDNCTLFWHFRDSDALLVPLTVSLNGTELADTEYTISEHSIKLLEKKFKCTDRVEICGTWGIPISRSIKRAITLLALEYTQPGITGMQAIDTGVDKVTWSDFSIEYSDPSTEASTGFREVDRLLQAVLPTFKSFNFTAIGNSCRKCPTRDCKCNQ
jgi:hypothetical protein